MLTCSDDQCQLLIMNFCYEVSNIVSHKIKIRKREEKKSKQTHVYFTWFSVSNDFKKCKKLHHEGPGQQSPESRSENWIRISDPQNRYAQFKSSIPVSLTLFSSNLFQLTENHLKFVVIHPLLTALWTFLGQAVISSWKFQCVQAHAVVNASFHGICTQSSVLFNYQLRSILCKCMVSTCKWKLYIPETKSNSMFVENASFFVHLLSS